MRLLLGAALVFAPPAVMAQAPSTSAPVAPTVKPVAPPEASAPAPSQQAPAVASPATPAPATERVGSEADAELLEADRALDAELSARESAKAARSGAAGDTLPESEETDSLGWTLVRTLLVLGVVVASIYLTLNVGLRKLMGLQGVAAGRQPLISVVERLPLDQRRSLFVVKAADDYLLLGGGEGGLQLLSKLDVEAVERIRAQRPQTNAVPLSPFLQKLLSRRSGGSPSQPPGS
ncbi:flagellar biosynthetic protein FliO [Myxococcus sp. SDU36]|uniref:flagellar biosynthetic protein FliO n=1 Tax=Myxococcus sp. SDU36 TaxID=2831967 RepID=UPI002543A72D|nr:flagellar biosynthetic protein FliO [Myxococcus sp. SDU36]WIG96137.1 flagellar biosynthetic protein FliO [Myxococcus sp. SDU36]